MIESYIIKIQRWYRNLPGCRKCGSKRLAWNYICVECYHDRHRDECIACNEDLTSDPFSGSPKPYSIY
jgi:hypothetical protein